MADVKKNERYIPMKNYVIALIGVVGAVLLTWYGFSWYRVIKENKISTSFLVTEKVISNEIKGLEEISDVFLDGPDTYYLYVSYTGSEEIYNMEKELADLIKEYNLTDSFYYFNITSFKDKDNYLKEINEVLNLEEDTIKKVPTIIYFKDGKISNITNVEGNRLMNVGDFQKLLDINGAKKE